MLVLYEYFWSLSLVDHEVLYLCVLEGKKTIIEEKSIEKIMGKKCGML